MKSILLKSLCLILCLFFLGTVPARAEKPYHPDLQPYITYLERPSTNPTDYIMELFGTYDIVILCERSHMEMSQYELLMELAREPAFLETVGHIFTEVGTSSNRKRVQDFLTNKSLTPKQAELELLEIYRNLTWFPLWEKTNFYDFLKQIRDLNAQLSEDRMIHVYPSDMPFSWDGMTAKSYQSFEQTLPDRDRIMADEIEREFRRIQLEDPRKKALVIMNYRHAFNDRFLKNGMKTENTGRYLFERFPGKVANVLLNSFGPFMPAGGVSENDLLTKPIQQGKWDAAFLYMGNIECGFDFAGTPFGADSFDFFPFFSHSHTYQDVFTGMIFFRPWFVHKQLVGIPDLFDENFKRVFADRMAVCGKPLTADQLEAFASSVNVIREIPYQQLSENEAMIKGWLKTP